MGRIVLMGSGETAPAMVKVHRAVLEDSGPGAAVMLDTPYGFQVNADDLTHRTQRYFAESVGRMVEAVRWRSRQDEGHEHALAQISQASWLFAGPGSPTYALAQWRETPVPGAISDIVRRGGTVVLGSAAAVTAGHWALPVYEIYKVGAAPHWVDGLDLLSEFVGLDAAVIPHYDNAEGGTYDTRFCYLGEARLGSLESELSTAGVVFGVDEHTAVIVDVETQSVEVLGSGGLTIRRHGKSHILPTGTRCAASDLAVLASEDGTSVEVAPLVADKPGQSEPPLQQPSLDNDVDEHRARFDRALDERDVDAAVAAVLDVEQSIQDWSADTLQSDSVDRARRELRAMVVRLGGLAKAGVVDPATVIAPLVEQVLAARRSAREAKDYAASDLLRDVLTRAGVSVNDTPEGVTWEWPGS
jgi:cyanophycinase-like exopeptidase